MIKQKKTTEKNLPNSNEVEMPMTEHLNRKHLFDSIPGTEQRRDLISRCALDEIDTQIVTMRHIKHQDFGFIADTLGLSYPAVIKRHKKALVLLQTLASERVNSV